MDNIIPTQISFTKINYVNVYLSYFILATFLFVVYKTLTSISHKLSLSNSKFSPDIVSILSKTNSISLQEYLYNYIFGMTKKQLDITEKNIIKSENEIEQVHQKYIDNKNKIEENNRRQIQVFKDAYNETSHIMDDINDAVVKTNKAYETNIDYTKNMYKLFSNNLDGYIKNLFQILADIQYQINVAYISPSSSKIYSTVKPLTALYNSIYELLTKNEIFIQRYTNIDLSKVKQLDTLIKKQTPVETDFSKSEKAFSGY